MVNTVIIILLITVLASTTSLSAESSDYFKFSGYFGFKKEFLKSWNDPEIIKFCKEYPVSGICENREAKRILIKILEDEHIEYMQFKNQLSTKNRNKFDSAYRAMFAYYRKEVLENEFYHGTGGETLLIESFIEKFKSYIPFLKKVHNGKFKFKISKSLCTNINNRLNTLELKLKTKKLKDLSKDYINKTVSLLISFPLNTMDKDTWLCIFENRRYQKLKVQELLKEEKVDLDWIDYIIFKTP